MMISARPDECVRLSRPGWLAGPRDGRGREERPSASGRRAAIFTCTLHVERFRPMGGRRAHGAAGGQWR